MTLKSGIIPSGLYDEPYTFKYRNSGIWIQSPIFRYISTKIIRKDLEQFDTIYLDPKDKEKAKWFIDEYSKEKDIFIVINCFEGRDPNLYENEERIYEETRYWKNMNIKGIILDFIRYEKFTFNYRKIDRISYIVWYILKSSKKELRFTILPSALFMGQNPWHLKKYGKICPMLYYKSIWVRFFSWLYGKDCEPIIKGWDTTKEEVCNSIKATGKINFSIFRYKTWRELKWF